MTHTNIVNIVNFVRGCEPRDPSADLYGALLEEIKLCRKYGFDNTILLQYDAMEREDMRSLVLESLDGRTEIGIWIEIVRPLTDKLGMEWRGRPDYAWDWHINPGFLMGYTQDERVALIDEIMRRFKEIFGFYPKSAGSWLLDAFSIEYMQKQYGVQAFCICREQFGIDAYTLWGGYFNGAYYPSRRNMLCPATRPEEQVNAPVFRMLGPDPIYNYGDHAFPEITGHGCPTIEPAWKYGQSPNCIDYYFKTYFDEPSLAFSYIQLGQENSFTWDSIGKGLPLQFEKLNALLATRDDIRVEKLCDSGAWFKKTFSSTPATALCAPDNWNECERQSFWYDCARYRANIFCENGTLYFRDIHKFDDRYVENWYDTRCPDNVARYDNLPVADGLCWQGEDTTESGLFIGQTGRVRAEGDGDVLTVTGDGVTIVCEPDKLTIVTERTLELRFSEKCPDSIAVGADGQSLAYSHNGFDYKVPVTAGITAEPGRIRLSPIDGKITLKF